MMYPPTRGGGGGTRKHFNRVFVLVFWDRNLTYCYVLWLLKIRVKNKHYFFGLTGKLHFFVEC